MEPSVRPYSPVSSQKVREHLSHLQRGVEACASPTLVSGQLIFKAGIRQQSGFLDKHEAREIRVCKSEPGYKDELVVVTFIWPPGRQKTYLQCSKGLSEWGPCANRRGRMRERSGGAKRRASHVPLEWLPLFPDGWPAGPCWQTCQGPCRWR